MAYIKFGDHYVICQIETTTKYPDYMVYDDYTCILKQLQYIAT